MKRVGSLELTRAYSVRLQFSLIEFHYSIASVGVSDAERLGTNAGTAEPLGVSPPEAVAYQVLVMEIPDHLQ